MTQPERQDEYARLAKLLREADPAVLDPRSAGRALDLLRRQHAGRELAAHNAAFLADVLADLGDGQGMPVPSDDYMAELARRHGLVDVER